MLYRKHEEVQIVQEEQRTLSKPAQLWHSAVKAVRGGNTDRLVEEFTAEMTLVAEGLAEDQSRLRDAVMQLGVQQDRAEQRAASETEALESMLREAQRDADARMDTLSRRMDALERKLQERSKHSREHAVLDRVTLIVSIAAGAWVLTALIG